MNGSECDNDTNGDTNNSNYNNKNNNNAIAILIMKWRIIMIVLHIFVVVNNSLGSICRSETTCHWQGDIITEYHQIKKQ